MTANDIISQANIMDETDRLMLADHLEDIGRGDEAEVLRLGPVIRRANGEFDQRVEGEYSAYRKNWDIVGLKDYGEFSECVEYRDQTELGDGTMEGEWFYGDDYNRVLYWGSFGNSHSPGASHYTHAEIFASDEEYSEALAGWENRDEYSGDSPVEEESEEEDGADEPSQDDLFTSNGREFYHLRRLAFVVGEGESVSEAYGRWTEGQQFWPNVWEQLERGMVRPFDLDD